MWNTFVSVSFSLSLLAIIARGDKSYRQRERTLHLVNQPARDFGFNSFANAPSQQQQQQVLQTPWWSSDELLPNVFPWLPNQRLAENNPAPLAPMTTGQKPGDLINFLNGPDGKDGPMKHIMRVLRILPPKDPISGVVLPSGQSGPIDFPPKYPATRPPNVDQICPSGTEPLFKHGKYSICDPKNLAGCPLGYLCDRSALLSEHICCKDHHFLIKTTESGTTTTKIPSTTSSYGILTSTNSLLNTTDQPMSSTKGIWAVWSEWTHTQTETTTQPITQQPIVESIEHHINETITNGTIEGRLFPPLPNPFAQFPKYPTPNQIPSAIGKRIWQPIDQQETKSTEIPPMITDPSSLSSTSFPLVTIELNGVEVLPLTVGNVMSLANGDFEWASTITLIRDGDKTILVDTGVPADTNILIRELSKHGLRPDNIDTVIITHGHPDHFGNQNLFSRKRQLFSSFEFIGNRFSRTALVDQQFRKLYPHIEVWKTPGHTPEDLSVVIRDVPTLGTVAVVGDLILNEDFLLNPEQWSNTGSWDRHIQQNNINMIVCMVDCIVPGHGGMFRLHDEHRKYSNCAQRYPVYYANYYGK